MAKAEKAEVIDFFSAWLDHRRALRKISGNSHIAEARQRIAALPRPVHAAAAG